jgi:putative endonuclease
LFYVYVIENVTPNHFYIGYTYDLKSRIAEHVRGEGAIWTSLHGVKGVIHAEEYYWEDDAKDRERELTLDYMDKYGFENVAGWRYTQLLKGKIRGASLG